MNHPSLEGKTECSYNYEVDDENIFIWWENIGKVKISNNDKIMVDVENDDFDSIIPFLLGPVMSTLLDQRGFLVLHGSAVKFNDESIAFVGHGGKGKSTTAINLYKKGYPIVTDDIIAIKFDDDGNPYLYPGYSHVRLAEDSYNHIKDDTDILTPICTLLGKVFCDASRGFSPRKLRLKRIYLIEKGEKKKISNLDSQEKLMNLISYSLSSWIFEINDEANNLTQCANLIKNVHIKRLEVTHSFKDITKLINLIEDNL